MVAVVLSQNSRLVEVGDDVGRWLRKMERVQKWEVVAVVGGMWMVVGGMEMEVDQRCS